MSTHPRRCAAQGGRLAAIVDTRQACIASLRHERSAFSSAMLQIARACIAICVR